MDHLEITFSLAQTRCNLDNDELLIRDMAEIFICDVPEMCGRLASLHHEVCDNPQLSGQRVSEVRHLAHSIKGLARTFGAEPLSALTERIEKSPQNWLSSDVRCATLVKRVGDDTSTCLAKALGMSHLDEN
jgi:HPt (histidine-containing phosphotransfer) domain-containing protein